MKSMTDVFAGAVQTLPGHWVLPNSSSRPMLPITLETLALEPLHVSHGFLLDAGFSFNPLRKGFVLHPPLTIPYHTFEHCCTCMPLIILL